MVKDVMWSYLGSLTKLTKILIVAGIFALVLIGCSGTDPTPQPQVIVVTATFTAAPELISVVTVTPTSAQVVEVVEPTQASVQPTQAPPPTYTPYPTYTPLPTFTAIPPTLTPVPPTATPIPPTKAPVKQPTQPKPVSYPPPVLVSPSPGFNCFNISGCHFTWSWGQSLRANEYYQVQLIGPANEHRGIHPPTKGFEFKSDYSVYEIVTDWCDKNKYCHVQWTVAVIEWDGKDPSQIGRTLVEAQWRQVIL